MEFVTYLRWLCESAAAFYSLTGTAKLCGLDPEAYLREVFTSIGEHPINRVTPMPRR